MWSWGALKETALGDLGVTQKCPKTSFHAAVSNFSIEPRIHLIPSVCKQHSRSPKTPTIRRPLSSSRGPPILRSNFPERTLSELFCLLLHTPICLVCIISLASLPSKGFGPWRGKRALCEGRVSADGRGIDQPDVPMARLPLL